MACYFQKCCFDSQTEREISECETLACEGKHMLFEYSFRNHKDQIERFYCLNRKQLGEYWHFVTKERDCFCPEMCGECGCCKDFKEIYDELQRAYFFYPRTDIDEQPVTWENIFKGGNADSYFRIEIGTTVKSDKTGIIDKGLLIAN